MTKIIPQQIIIEKVFYNQLIINQLCLFLIFTRKKQESKHVRQRTDFVRKRTVFKCYFFIIS
jgi:hypothetical protein